MPTPSHFLLVSDSPDDYGNQVLREALVALGSLLVASESELASLLQEQTYDIVIVDAGAVTSAPKLVSQIRELDPGTRIVVVTTSKHWKVARDIIRAGAMDYLSKSLSEGEMLASFQKVLEQHSAVGTADTDGGIPHGRSDYPVC